MVICLQQSADDLHAVTHHLLFPEHPQWFTFLVLAYPRCPRKENTKWVSACTSHSMSASIVAVIVSHTPRVRRVHVSQILPVRDIVPH